jgi:glutamate racemase
MEKNLTKRPIGVYDSGVGGFTVLKALQEKMPNETFIYFADTENLPYGNKTKEQIVEYSHRIISWFQNKKDAKMVIAACHTSSALAIDLISYNFELPIIGTIYPLIRTVTNNKKHKNIGIIATSASAESRMHEKIFRQNGFTGNIVSISCPTFVPLIESKEMDVEAIKTAAKEYLAPFFEQKLDTLIYGCTHYPFIKDIIEQILPSNISFIDPANYIADEAYTWLENKNLLNTEKKYALDQYFCSHDPKMFESKLGQLIGKQVPLALETQHASLTASAT